MNNDMMRRIVMRDRARSRSRGYDRRMDSRGQDMYNGPYFRRDVADGNDFNRYNPSGFDRNRQDYRYGDSAYSGSDYAPYGDNAMRDRRSDGHYLYPFEVMGGYAKEPYYRDFSQSDKRLSDKELKEWAMKLLHEVEEKDRPVIAKEVILKRAEELSIRFDKFSEEEFYVAVLMHFTDYLSTLGTANVDTYLRLAKDWLCDEDIAIRYGEKLAVYHDYIVEGM